MSDQLMTAALAAENSFSGAVSLRGEFNFSLSGTWTGTVTVQRSFDRGVSWLDVAEFTASGEYIGQEVEADVRYRFGIKTGDYDSGIVVGRLSQ
jgi:hypothetical protein